MPHELRVAVRLDAELRWARMEIRGCLTEENYRALQPMVERSLRILRVPIVVIDAGNAQHIEREGVDALGTIGIIGPTAHPLHRARTRTCSLIVPRVLPVCPSHFPALSTPGRGMTPVPPPPAGAHSDR